MNRGDIAIAKNGYHMFKEGLEITFIGIEYDEEEIYIFRGIVDGLRITQELIKNEFTRKEDANV